MKTGRAAPIAGRLRTGFFHGFTGSGHPVALENLAIIEEHATLSRLAETRDEIVLPDIELPEDLPNLYRDVVDNLATRLSDTIIVSRAADELHELMDRMVVSWDDKAKAHQVTIEGNLLLYKVPYYGLLNARWKEADQR